MPINPHNLAFWNAVAPQHVASPLYRTDDFRAGQIVLDPVAREAVGGVAGVVGRRLLHLQCHFGLDTLSLARMGATVTGLDFSAPAIDQARALAAEANLPAQFICADVLDPPPGLTGFDIVFASWGAIYWIADIAAWMRVAAAALAPGGRLILIEGHPAMGMFDAQTPPGAPLQLRWPYDSTEALIDEDETDYAGAHIGGARTESFPHGLARILTAALAAGLTLRRFTEGDRVPWPALASLTQLDRDYWALPPDAPWVPLSFTLEAVKAG
ncbi:MAG TPA: class I SAM-dependent methyltransferase [Caulobacteraceae bacterium]|nr:class I SAM-dependent methyltransferase [Caulobacteraceae bacterium]